MDQLGDSLYSIGHNFDDKFSIQTVISIGLSLLNGLEKIHESGYVHNDLKPDNVLVGSKSILKVLKDKDKVSDFKK